jgi:hypothetical protein
LQFSLTQTDMRQVVELVDSVVSLTGCIPRASMRGASVLGVASSTRRATNMAWHSATGREGSCNAWLQVASSETVETVSNTAMGDGRHCACLKIRCWVVALKG